ncbi:SusC/RagA family TonB-linked outer membrane protein [Sphingobacterium sp. HJSM2_6]|uniref:SusC/RagA family TonB-linked outer membrane protein n=1 Tax=Sphingobacterium sp. HJSM2_6 TaxID=3366264 RepID=UPI003BC4C888
MYLNFSIKQAVKTCLQTTVWPNLRFTTILFLVILFQVSTPLFGQQITISKKNAPLESIFREIRKQSGYNFYFDAQIIDLNLKASIQVKNATVQDALRKLLADKNLSYAIMDKLITITKKESPIPINRTDEKDNSIIVSGNVLNDKGIGLEGATVYVKGTFYQVKTGKNGEFYLGELPKFTVLIVSHIGYKTIEIAIDKFSMPMEIRLVNQIKEVEEVVMVLNTGYQKISPEQSTGAVAQISSKEYESSISSNFLDGLTNRLPGLMINNDINFTSLVPGTSGSSARPLFNVRGISTMSANQNPLIVLDGYPTTLSLDMIDPNEIHSVNILKDAAAATVYGVSASNGVIVIERKQAKAGKAIVNYRPSFSLRPKENYERYRWDPNAAALLVNYLREIQEPSINSATWNRISSIPGGAVNRHPTFYIGAQLAAGVISPEQAENAYAALGSYDNLADYSELFERNSLTQQHHLNVSGGNEHALYYLTGNYSKNRLSKVFNDNDRLLLSGRTSINLSKKFNLELSTDFSEQRINFAPTPNATTYMPFERFRDESGNPASVLWRSYSPTYTAQLISKGLEDDALYPLIEMKEVKETTRTISNKITANFNYQIGKGFRLIFGGIYETSNSAIKYIASERSSEMRKFINDFTFIQPDGQLSFNIPKGGKLKQQNINFNNYTARAQLNYDRTIGDHAVNAILGTEIRNMVQQGSLSTSFGYNDNSLIQQPVDFNSITSNAIATRGNVRISNAPIPYESFFLQENTEDRFFSGYSNIVYSYKNNYSMTGSVRVDQSNLFGTNPKYKYKPLWSFGMAWNAHHESFIKNLTWVDQMKFRFSYGFNGNVAKLSLPEVIATKKLSALTNPKLPALRLLSYANSSLRWEQTRSINGGLDFRIFKNIQGNLDYYSKKSTDLLSNALIDPTIGTSPTLINQGTILNNGIEFGLRADWIARQDFNWNSGIVLAHNTSKVLKVHRRGNYDPQTLNALGYIAGFPVGAMFAYHTVGINDAGYPNLAGPNGEIIKTNTSGQNEYAALEKAMTSEEFGLSHYVGTGLPTINAGFSNRIDVGSFYFFAMINYYAGFKVRVPRPNFATTRPLVGIGNYWQNPGDELNSDMMALPAFNHIQANRAYNYASKYIVHGDYLSLGDLTVSYRVNKQQVLKSAGFRQLEIKAQASNIYTIGFNRYNFSMATGDFAKPYLSPTYTLALFLTL